MVGKFFQEFFMFLMNGERGCRLELFIHECFERNAVLHRTVPRHRVNGKPICTNAERLKLSVNGSVLRW